MNRVLSIEQSRGCSGSSEYVTKRLCISIVLSIGFLAILGGYFLGRLSANRHLSQDHAYFSALTEKADELLKKSKEMTKEIIESNAEDMETMVLKILECSPVPYMEKMALHENNVTEYIKSILLQKENQIIPYVDAAIIYLDTL